jgi:DNA polymerase III sliding clamp (beta) subunit (PCNA family)
MRFKIDGADWFKRLAFVMPAIPAPGKGEKVWAEGILIEANDSAGTITLTATDIKQIGMKNVIKASVERSGKALIPGGLCGLFDLLQKDGELTIDFDSATNNIEVVTQYYRRKVPCMDANDFRVLGLEDDDVSAKKFNMNLETLKVIVDNVAPSADPKDIETGKSGVLLRCEQKIEKEIPETSVDELVGGKKTPVKYDKIMPGASKLVAVAADGRKLSKYEVHGVLDSADSSYFSVPQNALRPFEKIPSFEMLIPAGLIHSAYKSIAALAQAKDNVDVSMSGGFVTFRCGTSSAAIRLLAGDLPNWRRVLATETQFSFIVGTEDLKLAATIASASNLTKKDDPILIYIKNNEMQVGNAGMGNDKATRDLHTIVGTVGNLPKEEYRQGFRYDNVGHVLGYIKTPYVKLNFAGSYKPMTIQPCAVTKGDNDKPVYTPDPDFIALLMPLRINA